MRPLAQRSALIVGAGGLGSPAALVLARAGVGRLGVIDGDRVDATNLHRQLLHTVHEVGEPKVQSAKRRLQAAAPGVHVDVYEGRLDAANALELFAKYDVVLDGSDRFETRYLCNDAAIIMRKPLVHAGVVRLGGQVMTIRPFATACFRCLFAEPPPPGEVPSCAEAGILGPVAGVVGALQAAEALKLLTGEGTLLDDRLLTFDGKTLKLRDVHLKRRPGCEACGEGAKLERLDPAKYAEATCAA